MEGEDMLADLRGLFQDLSAIPDSSVSVIDRLRVELEAHIEDFRKLLDKPAKNGTSRQAVLSGVSYSRLHSIRRCCKGLLDNALTCLQLREDHHPRGPALDQPRISTKRSRGRGRFESR